jgi:hypothetical protein
MAAGPPAEKPHHDDLAQAEAVEQGGVDVSLVGDGRTSWHSRAEVAEPGGGDRSIVGAEPEVDEVADVVVAAEDPVAEEDRNADTVIDVLDGG